MNTEQIFFKKLSRPINGVVKADQSDNATVFQELEEYVVTNELEKHFRSFFDSYKTPHTDPSIANRVGVWISGFFGSGKSHFLKVLSYILANIEAQDEQGNSKRAVEFFDQHKLRDSMIRADIDAALNHSADVMLFNIDSKASSNDDGNPILNVFLRVFNEHQGFSGDHPHVAHMERHLSQRGVYESFKQAFAEATGSTWEQERDAYQFYQDETEQALAQALNLSADAAHKWFENAESKFSVSVENLCIWIKEYLDTKPAHHRVLFLVDEVGQFIGSDSRLMLTLQTITENLGTICNGRAWVIVTSQADMDAVLGEFSASKANDFSKIAGRFKTRLSLSSSNTDEVIQKRLLTKTPEAAEELEQLWLKVGDILRNQISFDSSGPTLKNFDSSDTFIQNYPFIPYQFQLVQKVFEEIRKVGATGSHLAYGERSMLDAFQMAALSIRNQPIGALVPMHSFYHAIEGFLDPAVKRTIDQAHENASLDEFDSNILRTLFMIRYVDLIKGTLDNLVTLSIEQIDQDKLLLRQKVEKSLQHLEKESLITRNGDDFLFLTNEERDITRKIKAVDISSSEENKFLSELIYKELLKDKNKFRYVQNKADYNIGRYLDGHSLDGRYEHDLRVEFISPLDDDYALYNEAFCINKSSEAPAGLALFKLADNKTLFDELRTWIRTNKYIRLNDGEGQADIARILSDRGRENLERKNRLRIQLSQLFEQAQCYALGQKLKLSNNITTAFDEACQYLLENSYSKLNYLQVLHDNPERELHALLHSDDITQQGLDLDGDTANSQALKETEQYIALRASGNDRILVSELLNRFSKRPYGWPDAEILILLAQLAASHSITFHSGGPSLALPDVFEPLTNSRRRQELSVQKKRQTEEALLRQARDLTQELFSALGPNSESELFSFYQQHFNQWLSNLRSYKSKMDVGHFPGKNTINDNITQLARLLSNSDSVDFFQEVIQNKNDYLDLEEDYRDIHEFFTNQLHSWQQLQAALNRFNINRTALEREAAAEQALQELERIQGMPSPYAQLHKVAGLIESIEQINESLVAQKRQHALTRVDEKIAQLKTEIDKHNINSADMSNQLLRPLQLIKADLEKQHSITQIYYLQTQESDERLTESLDRLEQYLQQQQQPAPATPQEDIKESSGKAPTTPPPAPVAPAPKPIVEISAAQVYSQLNKGVYLETEQEVQAFVQQLQQQLLKEINNNQRIRIR